MAPSTSPARLFSSALRALASEYPISTSCATSNGSTTQWSGRVGREAASSRSHAATTAASSSALWVRGVSSAVPSSSASSTASSAPAAASAPRTSPCPLAPLGGRMAGSGWYASERSSAHVRRPSCRRRAKGRPKMLPVRGLSAMHSVGFSASASDVSDVHTASPASLSCTGLRPPSAISASLASRAGRMARNWPMARRSVGREEPARWQ
mmetsp:Transcript_10812/g.34418  ORF Transcript_10812/g.34418 Transcript_10812/m.34418 type:complete len:210 (-) Transcript_10812:130-759(-)